MLVDRLQESFSSKCCLCPTNPREWKLRHKFFSLELEQFIKFRAQTKPGKEGDFWDKRQGKLCTSQINVMWNLHF